MPQIVFPEFDQLKSYTPSDKAGTAAAGTKKGDAPSKRTKKKKGDDAMQEEALPGEPAHTVPTNPGGQIRSPLEELLGKVDPNQATDNEQLVELGLKDLVAISTGKKHKKKLDAQLLTTLSDNKEVLAGLTDLLTADMNRPYYELAEDSARLQSLRVKAAFASLGVSVEEFASIQLKVDLLHQLRVARDLLVAQTDGMREEGADVAKHILALSQHAKDNIAEFDEPFDYASFRTAKNQIVEIARVVRLRDDFLRDALEKLETLCWMMEAQAVLAKKKTLSGIPLSSANDLLERANKECKMVPLYVSLSSNKPTAQVVAKLGRKQANPKTNQEGEEEPTLEDPLQLVQEFFEQDEKHLLRPELTQELITKLTSGGSHAKNTEKLSQLLQTIHNILSKGDIDSLDQVIEMMFEFKFNTTKAFDCFSQLQKRFDKVNREVQSFTGLQQKVQQSIRPATGSAKNRSNLSILRDDNNERLDVQKARDMLAEIASLPQGLQSKFEQLQTELTDKSAAVDKLRSKTKEIRTKLLKLKPSTGKSDGIITEFEKLIKDFVHLEFSSDELRRDLEKLLHLLKAFALLDGKSYDGQSRNFDAWKSLYDNIKEFGGSMACALEMKIKEGKIFLKTMEKIKSCDRTKGTHSTTGGKVDKDSLPNLLEAEDLLRHVQIHCKEIEFTAERTLLETMIDSVQKKLKLFGIEVVESHQEVLPADPAKSDDDDMDEIVNRVLSKGLPYRRIIPEVKFEPAGQVMLHDLNSAMDFFKRTPLNLKTEASILSDIEKKGLDFVQKVRELPPEQFLAKRDEMKQIYQSLGVRVFEWDDMVTKASSEEDSIQTISLTLKNKDIDLQTIQDIRKQYKKFEYTKDIKLEARTMLVYLQVLQREYERRQDIYVRDEVKPAIDYNALKSLIVELDDLVERIKTHGTESGQSELSSTESEINLKSDLFALSDRCKFLMELHNEIKRYLDTEVYTKTLADLDLSQIKTSFNKFVDLNVIILDYKTELEIRDRNKAQQDKPYNFKAKMQLEPNPNTQFAPRDPKLKLGKQVVGDYQRSQLHSQQSVSQVPQAIGDASAYPVRKPSQGHDQEIKPDQASGEGANPTQDPNSLEAGQVAPPKKPQTGKKVSNS